MLKPASFCKHLLQFGHTQIEADVEAQHGGGHIPADIPAAPATSRYFRLLMSSDRYNSSCMSTVTIAPHPLVVINQVAPVQHVHHGLKAEQRLLALKLVVRGQCHVTGCQLDRLISFCPCKLLQPHLNMTQLFCSRHSNTQVRAKGRAMACMAPAVLREISKLPGVHCRPLACRVQGTDAALLVCKPTLRSRFFQQTAQAAGKAYFRKQFEQLDASLLSTYGRMQSSFSDLYFKLQCRRSAVLPSKQSALCIKTYVMPRWLIAYWKAWTAYPECCCISCGVEGHGHEAHHKSISSHYHLQHCLVITAPHRFRRRCLHIAASL